MVRLACGVGSVKGVLTMILEESIHHVREAKTTWGEQGGFVQMICLWSVD